MTELLYKEESYKIQGSFYNIYQEFRNAHKEKVYHNALIVELKSQGFEIESEKRIKVYYKSEYVGVYVPDLIVNDIILIELKSKPFLHENDIKQFWQYLISSKYKIGYLVNFGRPDGVEFKRRVFDKARNK